MEYKEYKEYKKEITAVRLWSISPIYLDSIGLVALWREGLLAQKVLLGLTKGYIKHPQLHRFRAALNSVTAIGFYLSEIQKEAGCRGYKFDASRILDPKAHPTIPVHQGQLEYEWKHLMNKLEKRTPDRWMKNKEITHPETHPSFYVVSGGVEDWERIR